MTKKQLQLLISAGVFSAALLNGVSYADEAAASAGSDAPAQAPAQNAPTGAQATTPGNDTGTDSQAAGDKTTPSDTKHSAKTDKDSGQGGCGGKGGCGGH